MRLNATRFFRAVWMGLLLWAGAAVAQSTFDGTVTNSSGGAAIPYPTVSYWLNNKTNWIMPADDTPGNAWAGGGWITEHAQGSAAGAYSRAFNPSPTNVDMAVLAIGYQRGYVKLDPPSPVPSQTTNFGLTAGTLRIELESDSDVRCSQHSGGYRPAIINDGTASAGRYLQLTHYWTDMMTPVYFSQAGEYDFAVRYRTSASTVIWLCIDNYVPPLRFWPNSGGSWTTTTVTYLIGTVGWHNIYVHAFNLPYPYTEAADYLEITPTPGSPLVSATVSGTATTNGSPLPYVEVVATRDSCTNWPGSTFYADGAANGAYSMPASAVRRLDLAALAIGYQRQTSGVAPVATVTRDFAMTPGTLRLEAESDPQVIYEPHEEGWRPYIVPNGGASEGNYLQLQHNNTILRTRLYFAKTGDYAVGLRYIAAAGGAVQLLLDSTVYFTWPAAASWTVSNGTFSVSSAGWHTLDLRATGIVKGDPNAGVDYADVFLSQEYITATVTGVVRSIVGPIANARLAAMLDGGAAIPGSTGFAASDGAGAYSITQQASTSITLAALAVGYARQVKTVSPVANAMRNFALPAAALFLEPETDMEVTYQHHSEGYKPSIGTDATASQGKYLICAHYWTQARVQLYFPKTASYRFVCRYRTNVCAPVVNIDGGTAWSLPATSSSWRETNTMIDVSAGWRTIDLYGIGFDKAWPGTEGFDYLRIGDDPKGTVIFVL